MIRTFSLGALSLTSLLIVGCGSSSAASEDAAAETAAVKSGLHSAPMTPKSGPKKPDGAPPQP